MHVGANRSYCPELKVDKWEVKLVEDEFVGEHVMEESENKSTWGTTSQIKEIIRKTLKQGRQKVLESSIS